MPRRTARQHAQPAPRRASLARRKPQRTTHRRIRQPVQSGQNPHAVSREQPQLKSGVHPTVIKIVLGAALWFIVAIWLTFAWGGEVDFSLVVVTGFFVLFLALFLITASYALEDTRWRQRKEGFVEFLDKEIDIASGEIRGREVLIEIALLPVALAFGGTLIGLAWALLH